MARVCVGALGLVCFDFFEKQFIATLEIGELPYAKVAGWEMLRMSRPAAGSGSLGAATVLRLSATAPYLAPAFLGDWPATISLYRERSGRATGVVGNARQTGATDEQ
jgi:hypothetical protein